MAMSALMNASRNHERAAAYRQAINDDSILVSFMTITELRFGALRAGWGELRRRGLERDLAQLIVVQPDDQLMRTCAELRASCERAGHGLGHKIHEADRWIAATAIRLGVDLVSDDAVFRNVPDLAVRPTAGSNLINQAHPQTIGGGVPRTENAQANALTARCGS